jgi:hypothetical protein
MTWRSSTTPADRIFACLPYLLPLIDALLFFSTPFFRQFPGLLFLTAPIAPIAGLYRGIPFMGLIIFVALFMLVVRNENISHFIRFNTMQAIMLDIILIICNLIFSLLLSQIIPGGLLLETIYNVIFLGTLAAVIYSVVQCALGRYAEIPTLSEAVHMRVR